MHSQENNHVMQVLLSASDSVIQENQSSNRNSKHSIFHLPSSCPPERFEPSHNTNDLPLSCVTNHHRPSDLPPEMSILNNKDNMSDCAPAERPPDCSTCNSNELPPLSCITCLHAPSDRPPEFSVVLNKNASQLSKCH